LEVSYEPVYDKGEVQLFDIYIDGVWHGSARTMKQATHYVSQRKKDAVSK
jgi:hypothetical protein